MGNIYTEKINQFLRWVEELSFSTEINLFILNEIQTKNILPEEWEIKAPSIRRYNAPPLGQPFCYLTFGKDNKDDIRNSILEIICKLSSDKKYSSSGIANTTILICSLGSIYEEQQLEILKCLYSDIGQARFSDVWNMFIKKFNEKFIDYSDLSVNNFSEWEHLFRQSQYSDNINNPIELLLYLLELNPEKSTNLNLFLEAKPSVRATLTEFGYRLEKDIKKEKLKRLLEQSPVESSFFGAFFCQPYKPNEVVDNEILKIFIIDNWATTGKFIFLKSYSEIGIKIPEQIKDIVIKNADEWILNLIQKDKQGFFNTLEWPDYFLALGGWLKNYNLSNDLDFNNSIADRTQFELNNIREHIPDIISDNKGSFHLWFDNVYDEKAQMITHYINYSWFNCDDETWERCYASFKSLCYSTKTIYYGAYKSLMLARHVSNWLILLMISVDDKMSNDAKSRFEKLMNIFIDTLIYPWIRFSERDEIVWNNNEYEPNPIDYELSLIIDILKNNKGKLTNFHNKINEYSTLIWPII